MPACLLQKKRQRRHDDQPKGSKPPCKRGDFWEPASSNEDEEDSDDSMSDLYPREQSFGVSEYCKRTPSPPSVLPGTH